MEEDCSLLMRGWKEAGQRSWQRLHHALGKNNPPLLPPYIGWVSQKVARMACVCACSDGLAPTYLVGLQTCASLRHVLGSCMAPWPAAAHGPLRHV